MKDTTAEWTVSLDALEEWVRGVAAGAASGDGSTASAPELPAGPVPATLVGRARTLQSAMEDAQVLGREGQRELTRQRTYATA